MKTFLSMGNSVVAADRKLERPQKPKDPGIAALGERMLQGILDGEEWPVDLFDDYKSSTIIEAVRYCFAGYAYHMSEAGLIAGPFDGDNIIATHGKQLSRAMQLFLRWIVDVRLRLRDVWDEIQGAYATISLPQELQRKSLIMPIGDTSAAVCYVYGTKARPKIAWRGYRIQRQDDDIVIGGAANNLWDIDGWRTPGAFNVAAKRKHREQRALRDAKRKYGRKFTVDTLPANDRKRLLTDIAEMELREANRRPGAVDPEQFQPFRPWQLGVINTKNMQAFLHALRAVYAYGVAKKCSEELLLAAQSAGVSMADLESDPSLAGDAAGTVEVLCKWRDEAEQQFVRYGRPQVANYVAAFSEPPQEDLPLEHVSESQLYVCDFATYSQVYDGKPAPPEFVFVGADFRQASHQLTLRGEKIVDYRATDAVAGGMIVRFGCGISQLVDADGLRDLRYNCTATVVDAGRRTVNTPMLRGRDASAHVRWSLSQMDSRRR